jgi:hypothetical protein
MNLDLESKQLLKNLGTFGSMSSHGENTHDDWESAFKYLMKNNNNNISKHYEQEQQQQEDWLRLQEQKKHQGVSSGLGANQFNNMFNSESDLERPIIAQRTKSADCLFFTSFPHMITTLITCLPITKSIV